MLSIHLDLGNTGSVLQALQNARLAQFAVNAAAESYVDDTLDFIDSRRAFTPKTGQLSQSIGWRSTGDGEAEIYAGAEYAQFVEFGTRPHVIRPRPGRRGLKIPVQGGGYIIRRSINHPGSRPNPFFFADLDNRQENMKQRAMSVIAARLAHG